MAFGIISLYEYYYGWTGVHRGRTQCAILSILNYHTLQGLLLHHLRISLLHCDKLLSDMI
jgi:hypothetical protein